MIEQFTKLIDKVNTVRSNQHKNEKQLFCCQNNNLEGYLVQMDGIKGDSPGVLKQVRKEAAINTKLDRRAIGVDSRGMGFFRRHWKLLLLGLMR